MGSRSGTTSTYTYDAFDQRLKYQVGAGAAVIQQYDQYGHLLIETGSNETNYAYLDSMPLAAINPATAAISAIHTDRLSTPQKATNSSKSVVWSGAYQPFGTVSPTASITMNLRFPGQYADTTGFYYNMFRDYIPAYGRYLESDPIGLLGGSNTYEYANNNPYRYTDPFGLDVFMCTKPLDVLGGQGGRSGPDIWGNPAYHQYLCVKIGNNTICGGQDTAGGAYNKGKPSNDVFNSQNCTVVDTRSCMDNCITEVMNNPYRPDYGLIGPGTNCQEWAKNAFSDCLLFCKMRSSIEMTTNR